MEEYYDFILTSPLFRGVEKNELSAMLNCLGARVMTFSKNEPVFLEGDSAGFMGFILEGSVQIVQEDFYGNRSIISHAEKGDLFAEAFACANLETMPVSGYAVKDSKILMLSCQKMLTICSSACTFHNQLVKNLLNVVAQMNLTLNGKITVMSQKTTKEKLLTYLLAQAKKVGSDEFDIPFDRQALADYLGVDRSAMSTELNKLRKAGVLDCKGSHFRLFSV